MGAFGDAIRELPEPGELYELLDPFGVRVELHGLATIHCGGIELPIRGVVVGATRADALTWQSSSASTTSSG
jgi:hypothetical protein